MLDGRTRPPRPRNEPVLAYAPGSLERSTLTDQLQRLARQDPIEIFPQIQGRSVATGDTFAVVCPHEHRHTLARVHAAGVREVQQAIAGSLGAWQEWSETPYEERAAVFLRAADLLSGPRRSLLNAATMLGQSKTPHQAEIDAACELIDFLRFNAWYGAQLLRQQPDSAPGSWNRLDYRPLEGFVFAVTPFNFTAIAGNLPTAPALMGNVVLWKPAEEATLSAHHFLELLHDAGLPPGVISMLPGDGPTIGAAALASEHLAGVHFTGSSATFRQIWRTIGGTVERYRSYPRIVGETGGKDFVVAHPSAEPEALVTALIRGAFEYQGQKCSAVSRAYLPQSLYAQIKTRLVDEIASLEVGDPTNFRSFVGALINRRAFDKVSGYLDYAKNAPETTVVAGGTCDASRGYFVRPTLVESDSPTGKMMAEEIFGPVLTCYIYPDGAFAQVLEQCDGGSPYALTGAVFARDRGAIQLAQGRLRHAALSCLSVNS
jgi:1-pyrroline-5-carboxylate dehydrogenase